MEMKIIDERESYLIEILKEDMGVSQFIRELVKKELVKQGIMDIDEEI